MTNFKNLSFVACVEDDTSSFKEFFLMIDALMPLEWRIEFTFLRKMYCCGAEKTCSLPKWTGTYSDGESDSETFDRSKKMFDLVSNYFHAVVSRDDLFMIKNQFPEIFDWYRENSHRMVAGNLDNNGLIRQTSIIMNDMKFTGIGSIKLGSEFQENEKAMSVAYENIKTLSDNMMIYGISVATPNTTSKPYIDEIETLCKMNNIPFNIVSADNFIEMRKRENGFSQVELELYDDHSMFCLQDKLFLNKYDHLGCNDGSYFSYGDNIETLIPSLLHRRIELYKTMSLKIQNCKVKEYFDWCINHVVIHDDYTFIPAFMYSKDNQFPMKLVSNNIFKMTPHGILKSGATTIKPIVSIK